MRGSGACHSRVDRGRKRRSCANDETSCKQDRRYHGKSDHCLSRDDADSKRLPALFEHVPITAVPERLVSRLPRYPSVPAVLIGWLGRGNAYAGLGLGEALLSDAIKTVAQAPMVPMRCSLMPPTRRLRPSMLPLALPR
jgi:hypothetical protein